MQALRILLLIICLFFTATIPAESSSPPCIKTFQDTIPNSQFIYIGRAWRDIFYYIKGDPYLFSKDFLQGDLTINGRSFRGIKLVYDIYNDELITINHNNIIIQLNKEMIDSFTLSLPGRQYMFIRPDTSCKDAPPGFVNSLYRGNTELIVKYRKLIEPRAVDNKYDAFYQKQKTYIKNSSSWFQVSSRKQIYKVLNDRKQELRTYVKSKRLRFNTRSPETIIPVLEYYDILKKTTD